MNIQIENTEDQTARVIALHKGSCVVKNSDGEYFATITGKLKFDASSKEDFPAVGDLVEIDTLGNDQAVIKKILPRRTMIKRNRGDEVQVIATNVDVALVVESTDRDYSPNRFERYISLIKDGGATPAIVLNKTDLLSPAELEARMSELSERFPSLDIIPTSINEDKGLECLAGYIAPGKIYCFLGSSGVGKSSLINKLIGNEAIETGDISAYSGRGKHTTTSRQMYFLKSGGIVIDNPGMREVGLADASAGVDDLFDDMTALAKECKFADCTHVHEPGCKVLEALNAGRLDGGRYENYLRLKKETEYYEMSELEKRESDRKFGKFLKKAKKDLEDIK